MDSNWRPAEGWKNPFGKDESQSFYSYSWKNQYTQQDLQEAYEAGASAIIMLAAGYRPIPSEEELAVMVAHSQVRGLLGIAKLRQWLMKGK